MLLSCRQCARTTPEAFGDFRGQQVAMLETALARAALDMEINPTRPLMPLGRAQPLPAGSERPGPEGRAGRRKDKPNQFQKRAHSWDEYGHNEAHVKGVVPGERGMGASRFFAGVEDDRRIFKSPGASVGSPGFHIFLDGREL